MVGRIGGMHLLSLKGFVERFALLAGDHRIIGTMDEGDRSFDLLKIMEGGASLVLIDSLGVWGYKSNSVVCLELVSCLHQVFEISYAIDGYCRGELILGVDQYRERKVAASRTPDYAQLVRIGQLLLHQIFSAIDHVIRIHNAPIAKKKVP